ncbi:unnamed protein product [Paramecium primaurelia]|uniref:U3 small nucleolar RNA-associated protein 11 n=1 Tax=Paramecium primaurelia TaxID=5886 RepID=A0A8S1KLA0_PARPR|nr:unnamed protein product [Paramecium primaurelia]
MSNFTNAKPQRKYRERAQPTARQFLGILEKHGDYKKRAINYQRKKEQLQKLQLKAALRNKDEFNFRMLKSKIKDGVVYEDQNESSGDEQEILKQIKTQNQNLLKASIQQKEKLTEKLKQDLAMVQFEQPTHKFFLKEARKKSFDQVEDKLQGEAQQSIPNSELTQKINKLTETLYEKERLKRFYVAITKSKTKDNVTAKPHQRKRIKKGKGKGLFERSR